MASFYFPYTVHINGLPVIIYPMVGIEGIFNRNDKDSLENHVQQVIQRCEYFLHDAMYLIIILWSDNNQPMTDVWKFGPMESWQAGPIVDAKNFKNFDVVSDMGISAGDGLVMLGREEEHRRCCGSFDNYLKSRPELPVGINPEEGF